MSKTTIIIYAVIVGFAILSSLLKKKKKPLNKPGGTIQPPTPVNYNKPTVTTQNPTPVNYNKPASSQPKSLEELLQSILNEQKPQKTIPSPIKQPLVLPDKTENKSQTLVGNDSFNEAITSSLDADTELLYKNEMQDYDDNADHHVHGEGFDKEFLLGKDQPAIEENEWIEMDWKKAIIASEILRRPQY